MPNALAFHLFSLFNLLFLVYEAMDNYFAQNDDEIEVSVGDKVTVMHKNMDGWWKIK
jgi:hypothetical protein